jgi:hypothetical protein
MDKKPKARGHTRKTKQKIEDKAQSQRFIEAARATEQMKAGNHSSEPQRSF